MKERTKKLTALLLASAVAGTLVACGSAPAAPAASAPAAAENKTEAAAPAAEEAGDVTTISIYRYFERLPVVNEEQQAKVSARINELLAAKGANVAIDIHDVIAADFPTKANLALANNEINLLWTSYWISTVSTVDLYSNDAVYDISDLLPGTMLYDSMPEGVWEASKFGGKNYFIPVYKECYEGYDLQMPHHWVEEFGWDLDSIKKIDDIEPMLAQLKDAGVTYPFVTYDNYFMRFNMDKFEYIYSTNGLLGVDRATDEVINPIQTEEFTQYVSLMGDWAQKGYIAEDDIAGTMPSTYSHDENIWGISPWTDVPDSESNAESRSGVDEDMVYGLSKNYIMSNTTLGSSYCVTKNSTEEQAKAAIEFLGYLYTDTEIADTYVFGIEGEDYERVDGRIQSVENPKYCHAVWESTSVVAPSLQVGEAEDKVQQYKDKNENAVTSQVAGFRFDVTPVMAEWTNCANLAKQYGLPLENGAYAPSQVADTIATYQAELDAAGYQTILEEAKNQYEAWKKTK